MVPVADFSVGDCGLLDVYSVTRKMDPKKTESTIADNRKNCRIRANGT